MPSRLFRPALALGLLAFAAGCAGVSSSENTESSAAASESASRAESRDEPARGPVTATETAAAERRSGGRAEGSGTAGEMAKLVDQLNEAARELATLRTANAKLRAERDRPRPAAETAAKADPAEERLAAGLKSFAQFKQEMTGLLTEAERLKRANAELGADLKSAAEDVKRARASLAKLEEDVRVEKRLRVEAENAAAQVREQLRTIARAMADAGLSADKLTAQAEGGSRSKSGSRSPSRYTVREGDTLLKIAERVYGDADKWRLILEANRGKVGADGGLDVGTELQIPRN